MSAELVCFEADCRERLAISEPLYAYPRCGGLLEVDYPGRQLDAAGLKQVWRERRTSNAPLDQSGVWRYREFLPFLADYSGVVSLREGNTPLLDGPRAAAYGGLDQITFKHQG